MPLLLMHSTPPKWGEKVCLIVFTNALVSCNQAKLQCIVIDALDWWIQVGSEQKFHLFHLSLPD